MTASLDAALCVARAFFDALSRAEHQHAAAMVSPSDRAAFRAAQLASLMSWAQQRDAVNDLLTAAADGAVAWHSDGIYHPEELARVATTPIVHFPAVRTLGELAALSPDDFLSLYLDMSTPLSSSGEGEPLERPRYAVLGGVHDGAEVEHGVYRCVSSGYHDPHHVDVVRLVRINGVWSVDIATAAHDVVNASWLLATI